MRRFFVLLVLVSLAAGTGSAAVRDRTAPSLSFSTVEGQVFLMPVQSPLIGYQLLEYRVMGAAADSSTGVRSVVLSYRACGSYTGQCSAPVTDEYQTAFNYNIGFAPGFQFSCSSSTRRSCSWSTNSPPVPGFYLYTAYAIDKAGNKSKPRSVHIVVV
jgi:hypothetical protein